MVLRTPVQCTPVPSLYRDSFFENSVCLCIERRMIVGYGRLAGSKVEVILYLSRQIFNISIENRLGDNTYD